MSAEPARYVLVGDGQSPHLLKWTQTLHEVAGSALALHVVSSRGLLPAFEPLIAPERQLLLNTRPDAAGGNASILLHLPRVARWLNRVRPDVLHAHYLTSHGTLAWLAQALWRVPGRLVGSAWGSDVLLTPRHSRVMRLLTSAVLRGCDRTTSDSEHMAQEMRAMGARQVSVFPFGLAALPSAAASTRDPHLFFSNRGLEPWYGIDRVVDLFATVAAADPQARLVVAHTGSSRERLERQVQSLGLQQRVQWVGHLTSADQAKWYSQAQWYLSLPRSDSVSVSVLEAMAHGCIPILSDLPANRELIDHGQTGWIVADGDEGMASFAAARLTLLNRAQEIAGLNREWVQRHGVFPPRVHAFLHEMQLL